MCMGAIMVLTSGGRSSFCIATWHSYYSLLQKRNEEAESDCHYYCVEKNKINKNATLDKYIDKYFETD